MGRFAHVSIYLLIRRFAWVHVYALTLTLGYYAVKNVSLNGKRVRARKDERTQIGISVLIGLNKKRVQTRRSHFISSFVNAPANRKITIVNYVFRMRMIAMRMSCLT